MGKPIGYNPARLQRAYLPMPGIELIKKVAPQQIRSFAPPVEKPADNRYL